MGDPAEEKTTPTPTLKPKGGVEARPNKVVKKSREKKQPRSVDLDAVIDAVEKNSPLSDDTQDEKDKRAQGIVIDGRTYTCATCKTGHRVGVCKHARERPMTATHPPGRPPAGAPKKIICDCPKQCNCKKKGCKCPRNCSCTQKMYMLVYVPAPGEEESAEEEKGVWRLGKQVTTDLKGNILTPQQVKERLEQKEAQKTATPEKRAASSPTTTSIPRMSTTPKSEPKPKVLGGCCKHKENVATRKVSREASSKTSNVIQNVKDGCNCGSACACAFCPQHPNNSTSMNVARQQAMHFASQPYNQDPQSIVPFIPTMPQDISCMGGLPQFAISQGVHPPSSNDLQKAFPYPGYVMAYPVYRTDHAGYSVPPFTQQPHFEHEMNMASNIGASGLQQPLATHPIDSAQTELPTLGFSQEDFGIGTAFVASAGSAGWNDAFMSPHSMWSIENTITTPVMSDFAESSNYLNHSTAHSEPAITPLAHDSAFSITPAWELPDDSNYFALDTPFQPASGSPSTQRKTP